MPAFVVGRVAYDNWLTQNSLTDASVDMIDATNTILALHLTAGDGTRAGHTRAGTTADREYNKNVINPR